ncbi:MAG: hypothetical protein WB810_14545, partial [Candidatus Cybelea sp.]
MIHRALRIAAVLAALSAVPIAVRAVAQKGELVYNFTYSANQSITSRDASDNAEPVDTLTGTLQGGTNGMSHYGGTLTDKGTITVDIVKEQPDGAMVVMISEQGQNVRRAPPAECVVYGNTHVICDSSKTVYTEEYTLLRFLGGNFIDPNQLDAAKHWQIVQNSGDGTDVSADYTINSNNNGVMKIGESRKVKDQGAGHLTTNIETSIGYDFSRLV